MRRFKVLTLLAMSLLVALVLTGCNTEKYENQTVEAIKLFHERLNAEDYEAIYEDAYSGLKEAQDKEEIIAVFKEAREQLGQFQEVREQNINVVRGDPLHTNVACVSKFEQGDATELFTFAKEDGKMKLNYYMITRGAVDLNPDDENE